MYIYLNVRNIKLNKMKKLFLVAAATLGFQANAQLKSPEGIELNSKVALAFEGIELIEVKPGVWDYTLEGLNDSDSADYRAYKLYFDLGSACINATKAFKNKRKQNSSYGWLFHFEDCDVWYLVFPGGTVSGGVYFK